eukprot:3163639-Prymnesium_polylepis.2
MQRVISSTRIKAIPIAQLMITIVLHSGPSSPFPSIAWAPAASTGITGSGADGGGGTKGVVGARGQGDGIGNGTAGGTGGVSGGGGDGASTANTV